MFVVFCTGSASGAQNAPVPPPLGLASGYGKKITIRRHDDRALAGAWGFDSTSSKTPIAIPASPGIVQTFFGRLGESPKEVVSDWTYFDGP
jgi:hypothetical protein